MADFPPMTDKAAEAFDDYVDLGPQRSLEALAKAYQGRTNPVPTKQLSRLKIWSAKYQWQARIPAAVTERTRVKLERANELDAATFLATSERMHEIATGPGFIDPNTLARIRESVRKPEPKSTIDVTHSGTIKHAHHDMSAFTDEEIDVLADLAERRKAGASA